MAITVKTTKKNNIQILVVSGRLVNIDSEKFQKKLESFSKKRYAKTVVDISEVNFIDSFGLGTLVQHHSALKKDECKLIILNKNPDPTTYVQRLFEMTGLDRIFHMASSIDEVSAM